MQSELTSNPGSHVALGKVLLPLGCWDSVVVSCCRHECSCPMSVVCYAGSDLCVRTITYPEESYCVCACTCVYLIMCDPATSTIRWPRPKLDCCVIDFQLPILLICGPGSSVGIAAELRAGRSGIEPRRGQDFSPVQTGPGAHPASCKMGTGSFLG